MDRKYKYYRMLYDWIVECLTEDDKKEELKFFEFGVRSGLRSGDLHEIYDKKIMRKYSQSISDSIGTEFHAHIMRSMFIVFKCESLIK